MPPAVLVVPLRKKGTRCPRRKKDNHLTPGLMKIWTCFPPVSLLIEIETVCRFFCLIKKKKWGIKVCEEPYKIYYDREHHHFPEQFTSISGARDYLGGGGINLPYYHIIPRFSYLFLYISKNITKTQTSDFMVV